ncbi:hypothetical protein [Bifidobacterium phasiani]|uniref:Uncharacterized protein n=1 Tax=Bifidobacterium phasiani TaxID=2834431 RepID=A0ABS6W668_9BIFI|nr:hypothetical protein [Bifidobacterium phasiani]MBW3081975.1 hypothetical protein [Bifidobacterium phasiani]
MASDSLAETAATALLPYVRPSMTDDDIDAYESPMSAGEPYTALLWLLGFVTDEINIPHDTVLDILAALDDEDKDDYAPRLGL